MPTLTLTSSVAAPVDAVWARVSTFAGVNDELMPWLRMTPPRNHRSATLESIPVGVPLGRAITWYLGFLPLDYDAMSFAEVVPPTRFHEVSTMGSMRQWEHHRTLQPAADGARTRLTDTLVFEPRVKAARGLAESAVRRLFAHRHRRLRRHFSPH